MLTIRDLPALGDTLAAYARAGERVALVPTMGALHAGHMALVEAAKPLAERIVVSIFVNPKQFGAGEDLDRYPRREAADARLLKQAGIDLLWMPGVETMYPAGFATNVSVSGVSEVLDGAARPGHFDGVATIVAKLINQVRPRVALFGEKDFQQLAVIRRMVADLDMGVEIVGEPIVREPDGLARSSRNVYLSAPERQAALALSRAMAAGVAAAAAGPGAVLTAARDVLDAAGPLVEVDYLALVDPSTMRAPEARDAAAETLLAVAATVGRTRLIDNAVIDCPGEE